MNDDGAAELDIVGESNNESCKASPATKGCDKASISLLCKERGAVSVNVLLRLWGLVRGGDVRAVVRLSFVGVLEDGSESGSREEDVSPLDSATGDTGVCSSDGGGIARTGFLIVVGDELGLSKRSGLSERR
jgi:hypothetical protein